MREDADPMPTDALEARLERMESAITALRASVPPPPPDRTHDPLGDLRAAAQFAIALQDEHAKGKLTYAEWCTIVLLGFVGELAQECMAQIDLLPRLPDDLRGQRAELRRRLSNILHMTAGRV